MNDKQKQILDALNALPDEMDPEEVEDVPAYLFYLGTKTGLIMRRIMEEAKKETKH